MMKSVKHSYYEQKERILLLIIIISMRRLQVKS